MFDCCYLHIGFEKTGTTSIQQFLHRNRGELAKKGFYHPVSLDTPNNTFLYVAAADEDRINEAHKIVRRGLSAEAFRAKVALDLSAELKGRGGTLVLSNEHMHSEVRSPAAVTRLKDLLRPHCKEIKILAYVRRQDRVAVSQYSTALKVGLDYLPPVFPSMAQGLDYYFDYHAVLSNYASVFGAENIIARVYEKAELVGGDAVMDFGAAIGLTDFTWLEPSRVSNESLRPIALRFLAEANKHIPVVTNNTANPVRLRLISAIEAHFSGSGPLVSRAEAEEFFAHFKQTNELVRQRFFPNRAQLFSEDFSMYPEVVVEESFSFEDAARVAAKLWGGVAT